MRHRKVSILVVLLALAFLPACAILEGTICDGCKPPEPPEPEVCEPMGCPRELDNPLQCVGGECVPCPPLPGAIWNTEAGSTTCSTPQRPVKAWAPTAECPSLTVSCDPGPDPGPGPSGMWFPIVPEDQIVARSGLTNQTRRDMGNAVNAAMAAVTGCAIGQEPCYHGMQEDLWDQAVCQRLHAGVVYQEGGPPTPVWCGRHVESPLGEPCNGGGCTDQISVRFRDFCEAGSAPQPHQGPHLNFRIVAPDTSRVRWYPSAELDQWAVDCTGATYPDGTPPPPDPPPSTSACPAPVTPKVDRFQGPHPHGQWFDTTPLFYGNSTTRWDGVVITDYCRDTLQPNKLHCPARPECGPDDPPEFICHDRFACERLGVSGSTDGAPLWRTDGELIPNPDNIFQASCSRCSWIEICAADGTRCSRTAVQ